MRIGILSDTHDRLVRTRYALRLLRARDVVALVHCGDITGPEVVAVLAECPCTYTFGNHDSDSVPYLETAIARSGGTSVAWGGVVVLGGRRVGVVHGHLTSDVRRVLEGRPELLLSGHSHLAADWHDGPIRRINPGALHEAARFSVAVLDLTTDGVEFLDIPPNAGAN